MNRVLDQSIRTYPLAVVPASCDPDDLIALWQLQLQLRQVHVQFGELHEILKNKRFYFSVFSWEC